MMNWGLLAFTNALRFIWPALENEIDPADVLAMEGLRLFEPRVFEWIKTNRDFLFSEGSMFLGAADWKKDRIDTLHELIASHSDKSIVELLACLFPSRAKQITGREFVREEPLYQIVRRRGVGQVNAFQTYMALQLSDEIASHADIQLVVHNLDDEAKLDRIFGDWLKRRTTKGGPVIGQLLTEVRYRMIEPKAIIPTQQLLNALFSIGREVSGLKVKSGSFEQGPSQVLSLLITEILGREEITHRFTPLQAALRSNRNVAYGVELLCDFGRRLGKIGNGVDRWDSPISEADWMTFADEIRPFFEEDLSSDEYLSYPETSSTIRAYAYFKGDSACKEWVVKSASADQTFLLGTISSLLNESTSSGGTTFVFESAPDRSVYDLDE